MERRVFSANCTRTMGYRYEKSEIGPSLTLYTEQFEIDHKPKFKTQP